MKEPGSQRSAAAIRRCHTRSQVGRWKGCKLIVHRESMTRVSFRSVGLLR